MAEIARILLISKFQRIMCFSPNSILAILLIIGVLNSTLAVDLTLVNNCGQDIWPGFQGERGIPLTQNGGMYLPTGQSRQITIPDGSASTKLWARTKCTQPGGQSATGGALEKCETGDCGPNVECGGKGEEQPASLAEFTFSVNGAGDSYDVSYVNGYNIMIIVKPSDAAMASNPGQCKVIGKCSEDLKTAPAVQAARLQLMGSDNQPPSAGNVKGMTGMCGVGGAKCCTPPPDNTPGPCEANNGPPVGFSPANQELYKALKEICNDAYLFDFDDATSSPHCTENRGSASYTVSFCSE